MGRQEVWIIGRYRRRIGTLRRTTRQVVEPHMSGAPLESARSGVRSGGERGTAAASARYVWVSELEPSPMHALDVVDLRAIEVLVA